MAISRRQFVKAASLVTLAVGAPVKAAEALTSSSTRLDSINVSPGPSSFLNMQSFNQCLGTSFFVKDSNSKATAFKLIEVYNWQRNSVTTRKECFSLIFRAPDSTRLGQNTYAVEHDSLGNFQLFVVPIRRNDNGRYYEAVFNRVH
jgi:hypothetical protein